MDDSKSLDDLYVIVDVGGRKLAVAVSWVREVVPMPKATAVPNLPQFYRGVVNLRGTVMPVLDMRTRLGLVSSQQEAATMSQMLTQREEDHRQWLGELEASIREARPFTLALDPHQCAFGRWYDGRKAVSSGSLAIDSLMVRFENPHKNIHAVAQRALDFSSQGCPEKAYQLIEFTRNGTLAQLVRLFDEARTTLAESSRELAMVLNNGRSNLAVAVDVVEAVERLPRDLIQNAAELRIDADRVVSGMGRRAKDSALVAIVAVNELFPEDQRLTG